MENVWVHLDETLRGGESCFLATIVGASGSAPRGAGSRMLIKRDGEFVGSVGGGKLEAETLALARDNFKRRVSRVLPFDLSSGDAAESDMICGGTGEIFLDYVDASDPNNLLVFSRLRNTVERGSSCRLITVVDGSCSSARCLIDGDGLIVGDFRDAGELAASLPSGQASSPVSFGTFKGCRFFVDSVRGLDRVFVFGAGHVGRCVAPIARSVGFAVTVIDDRPEFANPERFPDADILVLESLAKPLPDLGLGPGSYVVIVTRGHLHDATVLEQSLRSPAAYIGMIGSKRKRDLLYRHLIEERGVSEERLAFVHSPIGIPMPAETPEEIAISITAELISVRAEKRNGQA